MQEQKAKVTDLATFHDAAKVITGDIIPSDGLSEEKKLRQEELAYGFFKATDRVRGVQLETLWQEYNDDSTEAAKIVNDAVNYQRLQKAFHYARQYPDLDFSEDKRGVESIRNARMKQDADALLEKWSHWEEGQGKTKFIFVTGKSDVDTLHHRCSLSAGGPGVGKGTQCAKAITHLNKRFGSAKTMHASVGDLLRREERRADSQYREFISQSFQNNVAVPVELVIKLLLENIEEQRAEIVLLDGFPLTEQQLKGFEKEVQYST